MSIPERLGHCDGSRFERSGEPIIEVRIAADRALCNSSRAGARCDVLDEHERATEYLTHEARVIGAHA